MGEQLTVGRVCRAALEQRVQVGARAPASERFVDARDKPNGSRGRELTRRP
jgi:hypothetical protein